VRAASSPAPKPVATLGLADDRGSIGPTDKVLLIVEDDLAFARVLLDLAREQGFKGVVAVDAGSGLSLARWLRPAAITLDLILPGGDGWTVLDRLKHDPSTRHIPVHVISAADRAGRATRLGAFACLAKPVTAEDVHAALSGLRRFIERDVRKVLLIEDDERQRTALIELIGGGDVVSVGIGTGKEALELLARERFDCAVLDLGLPDMDGLTLLEQIQALPGLKSLPIIVYTSRDLTRKQETRLGRLPDSVILRDVSSPERILAETALFLHRVEANLPEAKRLLIARASADDAVLAGRKALIVDDDVRNVFALTSLLERSRMDVVSASDGRQALDMLATDIRVDVILMDIMMPGMDGYATIRAIRGMEAVASVPIIAVTAKAMKGDREKCLEAGASGYITKPVDPVELHSLLRVWLQRAPTVAPVPSRPPLEGSWVTKASESS
jgi:CheY-like chemotaxis protein